jgi:hypothetical protein
LLQKLEDSAVVFTRGLPTDDALQTPAIAQVFSAVLCRNVVEESQFQTTGEKNALRECFHRGWLHTDKLSTVNNFGYIFPSYLHRWYVERKLFNTLRKPNSTQIVFWTL